MDTACPLFAKESCVFESSACSLPWKLCFYGKSIARPNITFAKWILFGSIMRAIYTIIEVQRD